jgi:hypothetical protein
LLCSCWPAMLIMMFTDLFVGHFNLVGKWHGLTGFHTSAPLTASRQWCYGWCGSLSGVDWICSLVVMFRQPRSSLTFRQLRRFSSTSIVWHQFYLSCHTSRHSYLYPTRCGDTDASLSLAGWVWHRLLPS